MAIPKPFQDFLTLINPVFGPNIYLTFKKQLYNATTMVAIFIHCINNTTSISKIISEL